MQRLPFTLLAVLFSLCYPLAARGQSAADTSRHAARLKGEWTFELRVAVREQMCSPPRVEGATTQTTVTISDSIAHVWRHRGLAGSTKLTWNWLGRGPSRPQGRFDIAWIGDSLVFTIDYVWTHDGGMYGWGRWQGDSIVGTWEQAGYCPTPSGTFVLRRARVSPATLPRTETRVPQAEPPAPAPQYPAVMLSTRTQGDVRLVVTGQAHGPTVPASVEILHASHMLFGVASRRAVERWRLPPRTDTVEIRLRFTIASPERCARTSESTFAYDARERHGEVEVCPQPVKSVTIPPAGTSNAPRPDAGRDEWRRHLESGRS